VIIWLLSNGKRSAYYRLPANEVFYSVNNDYCGHLCGKVQTITLKWPGKDNRKLFIPSQIRVKIWFGLAIHEQDWLSQQKGADLAIYAESYENQTNVLGKWTTTGPLMIRPLWSDVTGYVRLNGGKDKILYTLEFVDEFTEREFSSSRWLAMGRRMVYQSRN
jgi:hypothetical protein